MPLSDGVQQFLGRTLETFHEIFDRGLVRANVLGQTLQKPVHGVLQSGRQLPYAAVHGGDPGVPGDLLELVVKIDVQPHIGHALEMSLLQQADDPGHSAIPGRFGRGLHHDLLQGGFFAGVHALRTLRPEMPVSLCASNFVYVHCSDLPPSGDSNIIILLIGISGFFFTSGNG